MGIKTPIDTEQQGLRIEAQIARVQLLVVGVLQIILAAQLLVLAKGGHWFHVLIVGGIMAICLAPVILRERLTVRMPPEIQIVVMMFSFAALFLGEVMGYYERYWWWDIALHGSAGILLGLLGFMAVYVLNEDKIVDLRMRPSFLAMFACFFAIGIGALWEIFEFGMDQFFGLTMQKATADDPSGLTDTMSDLILDAFGAAIVSVLGWQYLKRVRQAPLDAWLHRFIARNPRFFGD